jgi:hypothetical protein
MAHCTDCITAAVQKPGNPEEFTQRYGAPLRYFVPGCQRPEAAKSALLETLHRVDCNGEGKNCPFNDELDVRADIEEIQSIVDHSQN